MKKSEGFCYMTAMIEATNECDIWCSWSALCVTIRDLQVRISQLEEEGEK
jgi:hypothetical protein